MLEKSKINHKNLIEKIIKMNGIYTELDTGGFIKELINNDLTHICLVAEDDSGEVQVDLYSLMSWGGYPLNEDKKFIALASKAGYDVIDRFLHKQTVEFIDEIWYADSGKTNNFVLPENKFRNDVLREIEYWKYDKFSPAQIKNFIQVVKSKGCTHIVLWDHLFQEDNTFEIFPIKFYFVRAEQEDNPGSDFYSIDSDMAKIILSTYLVSNVFEFRDELLKFKNIS